MARCRPRPWRVAVGLLCVGSAAAGDDLACGSSENGSCSAAGDEANAPTGDVGMMSGRPTPVLIDPLEIAAAGGEHPDLWQLDDRGLPLEMRVFTVSEDPWMAVVPKFLSDAEMEHLIEISEEGWARSQVGENAGDNNALEKDDSAFAVKVKPSRTSYSNFLKYEQTDEVKYIEQRLASLTGISVDHIEPLAMVRYRPGEIFDEHHDGGFRQKTVFIYLNDLPEGDGGETLFPELGFKFVPRRGCAVVWSNGDSNEVPSMQMVHQGLAPKTATKYAVNVFFNVKPSRVNIMADEKVKRGEVPDLPADSPLLHPMDAEAIAAEAVPPPPGQVATFLVNPSPPVVLAPRLLTPAEASAVLAAGSAPVLAEQPAERAALLESAWGMVAWMAGRPVEELHSWISTFTPETAAEGPAGAVEGVGWKVVYVFLDEGFEGGELLLPGIFQKVLPRLGTAVVLATHSDDGSPQPLLAYTSVPPTSGVKNVAIFSFGFALPERVPPADDSSNSE